MCVDVHRLQCAWMCIGHNMCAWTCMSHSVDMSRPVCVCIDRPQCRLPFVVCRGSSPLLLCLCTTIYRCIRQYVDQNITLKSVGYN